MQEICSLKPPMVNGICDPNKSQARHLHSFKLGSKLKYLDNDSKCTESVNANTIQKSTV